MNRREFMAAIGSVALSPVAAHAQEAGRIYRLGVLIPATRASVEPFFDELRISGFVEGQNLDRHRRLQRPCRSRSPRARRR